MTVRARAIGVDPGPVPGFVELLYTDRRLVDVVAVQCTLNTAVPVFTTLLAERSADAWRTVVQIEQYVIGRRSSRLTTAGASTVTRDLVGALQNEATNLGARWHLQSAGVVKPWAIDERLDVAGITAATKGMRHARDAGRHALFAAVRQLGLPDPLSKSFQTRRGA